MFKVPKLVLVTTLGAVAVSSGLFFSSPAQARDGCGRRWRYSPYWGQCVPIARRYATPRFRRAGFYWTAGGWRPRRYHRRYRYYGPSFGIFFP